MIDEFKLPIRTLAPVVDPDRLGFADTSELTPLEETIGQERAVEALEFGLRIKSGGFNIYVSGPVGTGKTSLVRQTVKQLAQASPAAPDWCYVNNFQDPSRPVCLSFPAGAGRGFKAAVAVLIESLRRDIPALFESKRYLDAKAKIAEETDAHKKALFQELTQFARERGFGFEETPTGFSLVPLKAGRALTETDVEALSEQERHDLFERQKVMESEIREFRVRIHALEREAEQRLLDLDRQIVTNAIEGRLETLRRAYQDLPAVTAYLTRVHEDIAQNYKDFVPPDAPKLPIPGLEVVSRAADLTRYQVNLVVEHEPDKGAPLVEETHPTYVNLIGKIERKVRLGFTYTDFTEIRAGAVLRANGGYLILNAMDVLRQPFSWDALKRVIKTGAVKIEDPGEFYGFSTTGLTPEPIPVSVKFILIGPPLIYYLLHAYEEDFPRAFKVKADFEVDVGWSDQQAREYARFVARVCHDERLPQFRADAVAAVIVQAFRLADRHDRLSLRFSAISDLIREAGFWAQAEGHPLVTKEDVDETVARKRHRSNLPEQWIQDEIRDGTLIVDFDGECVGQVNGLSIHQLGDYSFGRPCRITARTFVGTKGVIDIQREAELAGHVHSKGVLTMAGFLAGKFAGSHPFALCATLTFEQTYSEVEGDSAAVAELAAVLSSLAGIPVHQSLAITGSVNQLGEVQPIGSANEKIEGFFDCCKKHGLTGRHGVVIPARNAKHLALRRDVIEAVESNQFAVYGIHTVDEALEILTGVPAGEKGADGEYPPDSLYGRVGRRLAEMAKAVAAWKEPMSPDPIPQEGR